MVKVEHLVKYLSRETSLLCMKYLPMCEPHSSLFRKPKIVRHKGNKAEEEYDTDEGFPKTSKNLTSV